MRKLVSITDSILYPSFSSVVKWLATASATSFFAGYVLGALTGNMKNLDELVRTLRERRDPADAAAVAAVVAEDVAIPVAMGLATRR
jgi:hypothetical protein